MSDIVERITLYEGRGILENVTVKYEGTDGRMREVSQPVWTYGDFISVLPYDRATNKVLVIRQMRPAVFMKTGGTIVEACAGGIETTDKSIEAACRREAMEELGCALPQLQKIATCFVDAGKLTSRAHYFLASYVSGTQNPAQRNLDDDEDIEVIELEVTELLQWYDRGQIACSGLLTLTQALMLKL
ncbi:MAG: DNA mismatch repair protein MutT [Hyphomicrobiales bacterium]|nr:MAG: DNA mismatch repair protein MutT [Hyphomicrobiales bacterium]